MGILTGKDGYFTIVTRKEGLIITGGLNVCPHAVEGVLRSHPRVHEAAAIGLPVASVMSSSTR